ncbi:flavin-containing monooxygenase [Salinisphaera aquimarina]|uniref:Flavin-containing monooxygenase n=1 Tax=Salinisphaera aquimarina TaxID=2094031 RepID=A0ABV7EN41_9GAMM
MPQTAANAIDLPTRDVIVIGAGFSGINAGIRLRAEGIEDFLILERADDVGGTWRDNTYPGCACDVPSHLYSYSFEQNPDWSTTYSGSAEIQRYIQRCAMKYDLHDHLRFGVGIVRADFDDADGVWRLTASDGTIHTARAVISAVGGLVEPSTPAFKSRDDFKGAVVHTARWDHDVDLAGRKVVVIGTGASAIQVIPSICDEVAQLTVLQRSAPYVLPKVDRALPERMKATFRRLPFAQTLFRRTLLAITEGLVGPAVILDSPLATGMKKLALRNMRTAIEDPTLREKLTPDYDIGCKRVLFASNYYPALARDNVSVETTALDCFTETGIRLVDGREIEADVIVTATGFKINIAEPPFPIVGAGGETLAEKWGGPGGKAYKGVATAGVPNWFFMLGPNTGPGHTSVLVYTEAQAKYITQAIRTLLDKNLTAIAVKPKVMRRYHDKLQNRMRYTSWTSGCQSWYLDAHGENHTLFPGLATEYAWSMRRFKLSEYEVV